MAASVTCEFYRDGGCSIMLYGGRPNPSNCKACMYRGDNNREFAEELFKRHEKSHPPQIRKVSGCCDSALNPVSLTNPHE